MYRDLVEEIKYEKEFEEERVRKLNEKYDYLVYEPESIKNKIEVERLKIWENKDLDEENKIFSDTEMTDGFEDLLYKRYKFAKVRSQETQQQIAHRAGEIINEFKSTGKYFLGNRVIRNAHIIQNHVQKMFEKQLSHERMNKELEHVMTKIRVMHEIRNINVGKIFGDDPVYGDELPMDDREIEK